MRLRDIKEGDRISIPIRPCHIKHGEIMSGNGCPIALAIRARYLKVTIAVGRYNTILETNSMLYKIRHSQKTKNKILKYDATGKMTPFIASGKVIGRLRNKVNQ